MMKLSWIKNHPIPDQETKERLLTMTKHGLLTDMALLATQKMYHCHQIIFTEASPLVHALIKVQTDPSKQFVVSVGNYLKKDIEALLEYLYLGTVIVSNQELQGLKSLLEKLHISFSATSVAIIPACPQLAVVARPISGGLLRRKLKDRNAKVELNLESILQGCPSQRMPSSELLLKKEILKEKLKKSTKDNNGNKTITKFKPQKARHPRFSHKNKETEACGPKDKNDDHIWMRYQPISIKSTEVEVEVIARTINTAITVPEEAKKLKLLIKPGDKQPEVPKRRLFHDKAEVNPPKKMKLKKIPERPLQLPDNNNYNNAIEGDDRLSVMLSSQPVQSVCCTPAPNQLSFRSSTVTRRRNIRKPKANKVNLKKEEALKKGIFIDANGQILTGNANLPENSKEKVLAAKKEKAKGKITKKIEPKVVPHTRQLRPRKLKAL